MSEFDQLVLLSGAQKGRVVPINGTVTIGRNPENTIQFEELQVSRKHAVISLGADGVYIKDLGSGNGIYLGALRIAEHLLSDGDIIRIGRQQIQFRRGERKHPEVPGKPTLEKNAQLSSTFEAEKAEKLYQTFFQSPKDSITSLELKEMQKRLRAVYVANQAIASERSLDKVFDSIMEQVFSLITAHNGLILLRQEDKPDLSVEYVRSANPGESIHVSSGIIARAYENGEAIITNNVAEGANVGGGVSIIAKNISSSMCVPLTHHNERLGVIYVDNHGTNNAFRNNDIELLVALAASAASAIKNAQYLKRIEQSYQDTLVALANAIELRDHYTVGHTWRVTNFAMEIAREMGWAEEKIKEVQMGGVLHDVGKIAVDNAILGKPGALTEEEFAQMKVHPERGADLLRDIRILNPLIPYCLYHHEKWDGTGYPFGTKGEDIPIEGRLIAVADAFDAMTSTRPYRKGMAPTIALEKLIEGKNVQFDAKIVDTLESCYRKGKIDRILQDYYKNEAHSISCPFCSTFIRFDDQITDGSQIQCNVCHKTIYIMCREGVYFGSLTPQPVSASVDTAKT